MTRKIRAVHLSWLKRADGELGGVEKFAWYLDRALNGEGFEHRIVSWSDYPNAARCENVSNPDKALLLGTWAEQELDFDVAISDGYWGAGVTTRPVIPVVHGTWAEFHENMGGSPWGNFEVKAQHDAFNAPNAYPVACSPASARELMKHHRRSAAATILHGIDLDTYYPRKIGNGGAPPVVVLHAATNPKKGSEIIPHIARALAPAFTVEYLNAAAGEEPLAFQRGDVFLHPSRHEGNAYALLEAMATALPIVTTPVGLFESIGDGDVGRIIPATSTVKQWTAAVTEVYGDGSVPYRRFAKNARELAYALADFATFRAHWRSLLRRVLTGDV